MAKSKGVSAPHALHYGVKVEGWRAGERTNLRQYVRAQRHAVEDNQMTLGI